MASEGPGLTIEEAARRLGVHYMTVYRYIRLGRLPAEYSDGRWHITPADLALVSRRAAHVAAGGSGPPGREGDGPPAYGNPLTASDPVPRLVDRLIAGDGAGSWSILEGSLLAGSPSRVYVDVLGPSMRTVGDGWASGRFSVAEEHRATAVAIGLIGRMGPFLIRRGRRRPGPVLLAGAEGDSHSIPLMMVGDVMRAHGWDVIQLGADVPVDVLTAAARQVSGLRAVGISATTDRSVRKAATAVAAVHRELPGVPVLVGGPAITSEAAARRIGADGWAADADGAAEIVGRLTARSAARSR